MSGPEVTATTTELPESRVRLEATVPAELLERSVDRAAQQVGRGMRIPGFRNGKVPSKIVLQRVGREAIVDEAIRADINDWYERAVRAAGVQPVGSPSVDVGDLPGDGEPFVFRAEIGIIPTADVADLTSVKVGKSEVEVDDEAIDREIEALRERYAVLGTVEGRTLETGDYALIDFVGKLDGEPFEGGAGEGQLLEIGGGRFIPTFEEQLVGATTDDERLVTVTFPEEYPAEQLAGKEATFDVKVREVRMKLLPDLDDDFALEIGGVDTLEELRADLRTRLGEAEQQRIDSLFRLATLDAAAKQIGVEIPEALAHEHAHQEYHRMMHRFEQQGITEEIYLQSVGKTHDDVVDEAVPAARQQLARQAVASALVDAQGLTATDEEVEAAVEPLARQEGMTVKKALARLRSTGQIDQLRRELAEQKAVDHLVERAEAISVDEAKKADGAWTPSSEEQAEESGLWTI